jgi:hypothetical protein
MKRIFASVGLLVLAGCSDPAESPRNDDGGDTPGSTDNPPDTITEPSATETACRFIVPKSVDGTVVKCHDVVVPESRTKANGRTIKIHVAVFPGMRDVPPAFELIGGPGVQRSADADLRHVGRRGQQLPFGEALRGAPASDVDRRGDSSERDRSSCLASPLAGETQSPFMQTRFRPLRFAS